MKQIIINVKAYPGASCNEIAGVFKDSDGNKHLKVKTTRPAESGEANQKIIEIISKTYKVPKSRVVIERGEKSRFKKVGIMTEEGEFMPEILKSVIS